MKKHKKLEPMIEEELPDSVPATIAAALQKPEKPQIVRRPIEICEMCGAINSFRKRAGMRDRGAFNQAYAYCNRCEHRIHIRQEKIS